MDDVHVPLLIVQVNVAVFPAVTVTAEVADDGVEMVAVPLDKVHVPVPEVGVFPAKVKDELLHWLIAEPALEVVGVA